VWARTIVKRGSRLAVADPVDDERDVYDVVLLAGSPRRYSLKLARDVAEGSLIEVDGEQWTVADVRAVDDGPSQLICIYAA
jgi:hypothetical protein